LTFEISADEFNLPFFKEQSFTRHRCVKCGSHFWSKNPEQETCGEVPCQPYTFIGSPPTRKRYDVREMRIQFLDFFAERGHTRIKPYPIVARWRDDVYLVGASIYDFQPYVTEGVMPPPANPLVVSQPCIRFTDIEQVGPTAGRHLTIFEMGGHHAFNHQDREIYWKDETVRYHHQLLVDVLGVPGEAVSYKEHFWSGGGNAGPDLEGIVGGLEISTLVFMKYKVDGEQLTPTRIRTVDTGYGIERWAWLSQGSPSGFHTIYGALLGNILSMAKVDFPEATFSALARAAGIHYSSDENWRASANKWIAQETGLEIGKVQEAISTIEAAYALTDHSKAICFLLADGVVPSNVGEGYLARLIIRRAARLARQLGILERLPDIAKAQVDYWGPDFRLLRDMKDEVMEGLRVESKKYEDTLSRGSDIVVRLSKELAGKGVRKISTEQLVELYDSQGLSPEIVKEGAGKVGVEVEVPENFISLVAERHSKPRSVERVEAKSSLEEKLRELPPTRTLYYDDPYKTSFKAKVIATPTENAIVLDQTCFYPQGGGQPGDHGEVKVGQTSAKVVDVQRVGGAIVHFLDRPVHGDVGEVEGEVDWVRRQSLMRHHTATHALLGAARRVLGEHVWQAGAQKDVETSRLDITHYSPLTGKERDRIERLVNQLILRNVPVQASWLAREKAEAKYGFRLYQGGAVPGSKIRVVRIPGWDAEACGGTHCKRTGELGVFKIVRVDRLQDGVERVVFAAGESALRQIDRQEEILSRTSEILGTQPDRLPEVIKSLVNERDTMARELKKLREKVLDSRVKQLVKKAVPLGRVRMVLAKTVRRKDVGAVDLANRLKESGADIVAVIFEVSDRVTVAAAAGDEAVKAGVNAGDVVSEVSRLVGGGGGGRPFFATGGGPGKGNVDGAIGKARDVIERQLGIQPGQAVA
jgi:alanyl-tRNA synthetase